MFSKLNATFIVSCLLASSPVFAASLEDFRCTISTDGGHDRQEIVPDFDHGEIVTDVTAHDYKGRVVTAVINLGDDFDSQTSSVITIGDATARVYNLETTTLPS